jgi:hypothetical protein
MQLAWLGVKEETAETPAVAIEMLFALRGAPLVLKSDNAARPPGLWRSAARFRHSCWPPMRRSLPRGIALPKIAVASPERSDYAR